MLHAVRAPILSSATFIHPVNTSSLSYAQLPKAVHTFLPISFYKYKY